MGEVNWNKYCSRTPAQPLYLFSYTTNWQYLDSYHKDLPQKTFQLIDFVPKDVIILNRWTFVFWRYAMFFVNFKYSCPSWLDWFACWTHSSFCGGGLPSWSGRSLRLVRRIILWQGIKQIICQSGCQRILWIKEANLRYGTIVYHFEVFGCCNLWLRLTDIQRFLPCLEA